MCICHKLNTDAQARPPASQHNLAEWQKSAAGQNLVFVVAAIVATKMLSTALLNKLGTPALTLTLDVKTSTLTLWGSRAKVTSGGKICLQSIVLS